MLASYFEMLMMVCFGFSWPVNIWKAWRSRSTKGISLFFYVLVWIGYALGLAGKAIQSRHGIQTPIYVWAIYTLNTLMVTAGILIFLRNRRLEKLEKEK